MIYKMIYKENDNIEIFEADSDKEAVRKLKTKYQGDSKYFLLNKLIETPIYTLRKGAEITYINKVEEIAIIDGNSINLDIKKEEDLNERLKKVEKMLDIKIEKDGEE